jgi:Integral peroxisomal membrane peroxin
VEWADAIGDLTVEVQHITEPITDGQFPTLKLRSGINTSNIFSTGWSSETILAGVANDGAQDIEPERFNVAASFDGLVFTDVTDAEMLYGSPINDEMESDKFSLVSMASIRSTASEFSPVRGSIRAQRMDSANMSDVSGGGSPRSGTSADSPRSVKAPSSTRSRGNSIFTSVFRKGSGAASSKGGGNEEDLDSRRQLDIVIYENERWMQTWKKSLLLPTDFPRYSSESGRAYDFIKSKYSIMPPDGYEWTGPWNVDVSTGFCDDLGWSYGNSFPALRKLSKALASASGASVRRRKWTRSVRRVTESSTNIPLKYIRRRFLADPDFNWRKDKTDSSKQGPLLLGTCEERTSATSPVLIPYSQVLGVVAISPTVLSVYIQVGRCLFGKDSKASPLFRPVHAEVFIHNCPAEELRSLIEERIQFFSIRNTISRVIDDIKDANVSSNSVNSADGVDLQSDGNALSTGSALMMDLDAALTKLDDKVAELTRHLDSIDPSADHYSALFTERSFVERRALRMRLYIGIVLGLGLEGKHSYDDATVRQIMESDFARMQTEAMFQKDDEIDQANIRMEFLIDQAESRLRDATLFGWNYRGGKLQHCLDVFVNGYFIELVALLGKYFDGSQRAIKVKRLSMTKDIFTSI